MLKVLKNNLGDQNKFNLEDIKNKILARYKPGNEYTLPGKVICFSL